MPAKGALDDRRVSKLSDYEALESARIPLNSVRGSSRGVSHKAVHGGDVVGMHNSNFGNSELRCFAITRALSLISLTK